MQGTDDIDGSALDMDEVPSDSEPDASVSPAPIYAHTLDKSQTNNTQSMSRSAGAGSNVSSTVGMSPSSSPMKAKPGEILSGRTSKI